MLVIEQRWIMYSLFIGLTLGGIPLVWRLAHPATPGVYGGAAAAFVLMVVMQLGLGGGRDGEASLFLLQSDHSFLIQGAARLAGGFRDACADAD